MSEKMSADFGASADIGRQENIPAHYYHSGKLKYGFESCTIVETFSVFIALKITEIRMNFWGLNRFLTCTLPNPHPCH